MIEALIEAEQLLVMGMLDQAEALYRKSADADPRNAIAVVGLARVAVERGQDRLAYDYAVAALEIDPEDWLALRMEARLSETLAARGEPVERPGWITRGQGPPPPVAQPREAAAATSVEDPEVRAQHAAFARNPSMADHRLRMEGASQQASPPATPGQPPEHPLPAAKPSPAEQPPSAEQPRRSLLRRLFRR